MFKKLLRAVLAELMSDRPGPLYLVVGGQDMTKFTLKVLFPPAVDGDVATREFTYTVNDESPVATPLPATASEFTFSAPRDAGVLLSLVDVDVAGNRSSPSERKFVVTDTIPPQQPGEMNVSVTGQVEE